MLAALLKGKLSRTQENMEDILTSNVFGLLKYLPPEEGILPVLARARAPSGQLPFQDIVGIARSIKVEYTFWPRYSERDAKGCEPDVQLLIYGEDTKRILVFVEAKYLSGKSSEEELGGHETTQSKPPVDQLACEWQYLVLLGERKKAEPILVYLTADIDIPHQDIETSREAFMRKCPASRRPFECAWLSWRHISEAVKSSRSEAITNDLDALLERLNLVFFHGFSLPSGRESIQWRFERQVSAILGTGWLKEL